MLVRDLAFTVSALESSLELFIRLVRNASVFQFFEVSDQPHNDMSCESVAEQMPAMRCFGFIESYAASFFFSLRMFMMAKPT